MLSRVTGTMLLNPIAYCLELARWTEVSNHHDEAESLTDHTG